MMHDPGGRLLFPGLLGPGEPLPEPLLPGLPGPGEPLPEPPFPELLEAELLAPWPLLGG